MKQLLAVLALAAGLFWIVNNSDLVSSEPEKTEVDPRLKQYVKEWCWEMEKAGLPWEERIRRVKSIRVEPYSVDSRMTGRTHNYTHRVTINENYLDRNPCGVRATVFHELGHAAFDLPHGCCFIMRAESEPDEDLYCRHWSVMVADYVVQCKKAASEE